VTDVLHALGALPAGFRDSTLAKYKQHGQFQLSNFSFHYFFLLFDVIYFILYKGAYFSYFCRGSVVRGIWGLGWKI